MENTFNVFVDNYMRAYLPLWKMIYKKYSGKHMQPGQKNSMEADEFADFSLVPDRRPSDHLTCEGLADRRSGRGGDQKKNDESMTDEAVDGE